MGGRRFYWLKLKNDFFEQKEIKKLRRIAGGDTFTIIYLKMQLLSLKSDGKLFFDGVEDTFAEELALTLDETPENVEMTLSFLRKHELIEQVESDEYILPETVKSIGSEGSSAERMRRLRTKASQCDGLLSQGDSSVTKSDVEIEIEREIEKEKEKDTTPVPIPEPPKPPKPSKPVERKERYLEFVTLTQKEYDSLVSKLGSEKAVQRCIEILNDWKGSKGKKYKSDFYAMHSWVIERYYEELSKKGAKQGNGQSIADKFAKVRELAEQEGWGGMI